MKEIKETVLITENKTLLSPITSSMESLKALIAPKMEVSALNMISLVSCSLEELTEEKVFMLQEQ